jgi:hypothetical protein
MLNLILQIILGIFIVLIMGFIAYSIFDREYLNSIRLFNTNKKETQIFTGIYPLNLSQARIETLNKNDPYYLNINPSVNQNGGAEYSYNFWLYFNIKPSSGRIIEKINTSTTTNLERDSFIVLFYKGVKQLVPYKQNRLSCDTDKDDNKRPNPYFLVKNPLVKLNNNGKELVVEYNNLNNPDSFHSSAVKLICSEVKDKMYGTNVNKLGVKNINTDMYNKTWNMITIVLQESPSNEEKLFTNRTNCKIYFNSTLISDRSTFNNDVLNLDNETGISTAMKNNIGNLYINPKTNIEKAYLNSFPAVINHDLVYKIDEITEDDGIKKDSPIKMANMSYFNYALNDNQILELFNKGFDKKMSDLSIRMLGMDKMRFVQGNKISYNLMANTDSAMPVEPI